MGEQISHRGGRQNISSVSLTLQQLVGGSHLGPSNRIDQGLVRLTQYALAATDISHLLEKGVDIIAEAVPLAYVLAVESRCVETPFCMHASKARSPADMNEAVCVGWCRTSLYFQSMRSENCPQTAIPSFHGNPERVILISGRNKPFGMLIVAEHDHVLTDGEVQFMRTVADVLAIAIDRIQVQRDSIQGEETARQRLVRCVEKRTAQLAKTIVHLAQSIEQHKRTEAALRRSEQDLRSLSAQLIEVGEQERKRIARELHDGISQTMTSIKYRLENGLHQFAKGATNDAITTIETVVPIIQHAMQEVRRISMDLRPSMLDDIGILATIEWYCREFQTTYRGIHVAQCIDVREEEIGENLKLVICRVMQEALHNIARHSSANLARLELRRIEGKLALSITDNGIGFTTARRAGRTQEGPCGLGLRSMRERVEQSLGEFVIASTPGGGTRVEATWPLGVSQSMGGQPMLHGVHG